MNLIRTFRIILLFAAVISLGGFGISEENIVLGVVLVGAAIAGWTMTEFAKRGIPRWATNLMLIGLLIGACIRVLQGGAPVSAFNGFLASLLVLKLWERREIRDYGQVLTMSLFLAIGGTLNQSTLGVGITLVLLAPVLIAGTMMLQVLSPWSRFQGATPATADTRTQRSIPSLKGIGLLSGIVGVAIACVVFITVPRGIGLSQFGRFGGVSGGRMIGFTDQVQLGQGGLLSESQEIVLALRLFDAEDRPLGGLGQVQYLRGSILESYDEGRWTTEPRTARRRQHELRDRGQSLVLSPLPPNAVVMRQQFRLRHVGDRFFPLFTILVPRSVTLSKDSRMQVDYRTEAILREGESGPLEYTVYSTPDVAEGPVTRGRLPVALESPKFFNLARDLLSEAGISPDPAVRIVDEDATASRIFESYLRNNLTYTREIMSCPPGRDPTEWFLFEAKTGHCEYFASALAALCRSVGIDARVVTGYVAGEFDPVTFEYIVRSSSAHAWVEVKVGPSQWRTMDGTPPEDMPVINTDQSSLWRRVMRSFESVQDLWADSIVSFDSSRQSRLFGGNGFESPPATRWIERFARGRTSLQSLDGASALRLVGAVVGWGMIIGGVVFWIKRVHARRREAVTSGFGPLADLYRSLLDRFVDIGHPKPGHVSALRHAHSLRAINPEAAHLETAAQLLFRARFADAPLSPEELAQVQAAITHRRRSVQER